MTSAPSALPVPAGADVEGAAVPDRTNIDRTDVDRTDVDLETTDFGRASMLLWRPLLEAECSR